MKSWRTALVVCIVAAIGTTVAGCGSGSADKAATTATAAAPATTDAAPAATTDTAAADPNASNPDVAKLEVPAAGSGAGVKIGYISLGDQVPFVKLVSDDIRKQAKTAGANLVFCDSQLDAAKALDCAKSFKTQGVQVIINFQVDEKSSPRICAAGPKVPTIAVDINQKPCQVAFMGANNKFAGQIAGEAMGKYAKANFGCKYDAVVSMQQPAAGIVNTDRSGGMLDAFEQACGKIKNLKIVDGGGTIEGGQKKFADVLTSLPGKHRIIVMSLNDDMSLGSLAAAKAQGRTKDLYIAGQGADPTSYCQIKTNPQWIGDAAYFPEKYGQIAVPAAIKAAKGETLPSKLLVPHVLINKDNLQQYYTPTGC
jgi:ribose transport system substrate-binding protein